MNEKINDVLEICYNEMSFLNWVFIYVSPKSITFMHHESLCWVFLNQRPKRKVLHLHFIFSAVSFQCER